MTITPEQLEAAKTTQFEAAHDLADQVLLLAGPGTGKSFAIGERVNYLLNSGVSESEIIAVSFTRAASKDLSQRIIEYCRSNGNPDVEYIRVSTLHSLALMMLRKAQLLTLYPSSPQVLDDWELKNIYDQEFKISGKIKTIRRCSEIRNFHEAFWNTDSWTPGNYIPPTPPINEAESDDFNTFHSSSSQLFSCVLPGEIVRQCVMHMEAGLLAPLELLEIKYLIVDEYQDLNPMDLRFVDYLIHEGVSTFIAGDDDQSIYSFRYAMPAGIEQFTEKYEDATKHTLDHCFRCTPAILNTAEHLIAHNSSAARLQKDTKSLYENSSPPVPGYIDFARYSTANLEAKCVASTCRALIDTGVDPDGIMILLANKKRQASLILSAMEDSDVNYEYSGEKRFVDTEPGRLIFYLSRIAINQEDWLAHRALLSMKRGLSHNSVHLICQKLIDHNLNIKKLIYEEFDSDHFTRRVNSLLNVIRPICLALMDWDKNDSIADRIEDLLTYIRMIDSAEMAVACENFISTLPQKFTISDMNEYLGANKKSYQKEMIRRHYEKVGEASPEDQTQEPSVQVMTMHSAKGLSADIVIIPGLEEPILPGGMRSQSPGLIFEAARLLYVSITRGKAACLISYAQNRVVFGNFELSQPSRFCLNLNGRFQERTEGLQAAEIQQIVETIDLI